MKPLQIGLIGTGRHGSRYARHILEDIPEAELTALCRRDPVEGGRLAAHFGCRYYGDYERLLADPRIEAVVIAVPPALHGEIVEATCRAGKHLLLEKPLAVRVSEARRIVDLITASRVRCMIAHTLRFNAVIQVLKAHIPQIAPLHSMHFSQCFAPGLGWRERQPTSGGGVVLDAGVHAFDLLRFLSDREVEEVWCQTSRVVTAEEEDTFVMMCRMSDPVLKGTVMCSRGSRSRSGFVEPTGEKGQLLGSHTDGFALLVDGPERRPLSVGQDVPTVREALRAFVDSLLYGTEFPITPEDGLRAEAIAEACYRSADSGQAVAVER